MCLFCHTMMLFLKLKHPLMLFAAAQELEEAKSGHFSRYSAKGTASRSSLLVLPHHSKVKYPLMLCVPGTAQQLEEAKSGVPL